MPATQLRRAFLSIFIFDSDLEAHAQHQTGSVRKLDAQLTQQRT